MSPAAERRRRAVRIAEELIAAAEHHYTEQKRIADQELDLVRTIAGRWLREERYLSTDAPFVQTKVLQVDHAASMLRRYRARRPTPPAPACDGCREGLPLQTGAHWRVSLAPGARTGTATFVSMCSKPAAAREGSA